MLKRKFGFPLVLMALSCGATMAVAGEGDITIPDLTMVKFDGLGGISGAALMYLGLVICGIGAVFGLVQYRQTKSLPAHESMANVSNTIWETCKTYLWTQGKFLAILWLLIAACMIYYFKVLQENTIGHVIIILLCSVLGILGSYGVAWFGIRINTVANSRTAFSALQGNPLATLGIPLRSGMSVGLLLVAVELFFMICILMFLKELAGPCFIGFAIGESLGASVLRICGGIFTKIADIGSDLMKIVFIRSDPMSAILVKMPPQMRSTLAPSDSPMAKPMKQGPASSLRNIRMQIMKNSSTATSSRPTLIPERSGMPRVASGLPCSAENAVRELATVLMRMPNHATP